MKYRGNNICVDERTNERTEERRKEEINMTARKTQCLRRQGRMAKA